MFNIAIENYSAVYGVNEKEVNAKIEKLLHFVKIIYASESPE